MLSRDAFHIIYVLLCATTLVMACIAISPWCLLAVVPMGIVGGIIEDRL
jgi:hypothetical protein